jgi:hypothetical protein
MWIGFLRAPHIDVHSPEEFPGDFLRMGMKGRERAHRKAWVEGAALEDSVPFGTGDIALNRAQHTK